MGTRQGGGSQTLLLPHFLFLLKSQLETLRLLLCGSLGCLLQTVHCREAQLFNSLSGLILTLTLNESTGYLNYVRHRVSG